MKKVAHDPNEILAVVDEADNILSKATRKEIHQSGAQHREVACYLINSKNEVLLQKRSDSHLWDHTVAGHFPFNQSYEEAIEREFVEEMGIKIKKSEFKEIAKEKGVSKVIINNRFVKLFIVKKDIPLQAFKIDKEEIEEIKYFTIPELETLLKTKFVTSTTRYFLEKYIMPLMTKEK
jgi:isopentenyldiphosphate isomerase